MHQLMPGDRVEVCTRRSWDLSSRPAPLRGVVVGISSRQEKPYFSYYVRYLHRDGGGWFSERQLVATGHSRRHEDLQNEFRVKVGSDVYLKDDRATEASPPLWRVCEMKIPDWAARLVGPTDIECTLIQEHTGSTVVVLLSEVELSLSAKIANTVSWRPITPK